MAALACVVSGCTSPSDPGSTPSPTASSSAAASPSASPSAGPATLRLAVYGDPAEVRAYRALARAFTEHEPAVSVKVSTSSDADSAHARLDGEFAASARASR